MIKQDSRNYRIHTDQNKELIRKSLEDCGAGRSILVDKNDRIIAGNGIFEQAQALNIPTEIIETDGKKLIVVKRTDLDTYDDKRVQLAVMDNATQDLSHFDEELLKTDFNLPTLEEWGVYLDELADIDTSEFTNPQTENERNNQGETLEITCPHCGKKIQID